MNVGAKVSRVDERTRRVADNEVLFRTVNDRLEDLNEGVSNVTDTFCIVCECGDISCSEQITISSDEYTRLRSQPTDFAVMRGHEAADSENVVERYEAYDVVRKHEGVPSEIAEDSAP